MSPGQGAGAGGGRRMGAAAPASVTHHDERVANRWRIRVEGSRRTGASLPTYDAAVLLTSTTTDPAAFAAATGWAVKPEGACRADMCVPLPDDVHVDGGLDVSVLADRLGMPVLRDDDHGLVALGPATVVGRALETAEAPELELPDADGNPFRLSSLHGKKVLLVAWASW